MTMAKQHISSASLTGPYWNDINFSPLLAIPDVGSFQNRSLALAHFCLLAPCDVLALSFQCSLCNACCSLVLPT